MNPYKFQLDTAYPNPFNPTTVISYKVPVGMQFTIRIFDITGNLVKTLISEKQSAGQGIVRWDGQNDAQVILPSGVYFYRMSSADYTETKKIIFLK